MVYEELYEGEEVNGEPLIYIDENCTKLFSGHVESYFQKRLSWECDIVDGLKNGIEKFYYDYTGELESVHEVKCNVSNGLSIEYYKTGTIRCIAIMVDNLCIDFYSYHENGEQDEVWFMDEKELHYPLVKNKIPTFREKYDIKKLNEEILKYGKPVRYGKSLY